MLEQTQTEAEQAKSLLQAIEQEKFNKFKEGLESLSKEFGYTISSNVGIVEGKIISEPTIVKNDK